MAAGPDLRRVYGETIKQALLDEAGLKAALAVFSVIRAWSNLRWRLIVLQEAENFTLPLAVNPLMGLFASNQRYAYAGALKG